MTKKFVVIIGALLLMFFIITAAFPELIAPYSAKDMDSPWLSSSSEHILGTNKLGYDVFSELIFATRKTLITGVLASTLSLIIATLLGYLCLEENIVGKISKTIIDTMTLLPRLVTMIVLSSFFNTNSFSLIVLISIFSFAASARAISARVRMIKKECFIESLTVQGFSKMHILIFHIIPSLKDILLTRFLLGINSAIMLESTLSFLGLGDIYNPTWGTMVNLAYKNGAFLRHHYCYLLSPGVMIMLLTLSFYMVSLAIELKHEEIKETT